MRRGRLEPQTSRSRVRGVNRSATHASTLTRYLIFFWVCILIVYHLFLLLAEANSIALSDNIKIASWLPQNDILGHPKTRLFFGHAGLNGMFESIYHGVPMICSPFFGDQFDNSQAAKRAGFAESLNLGEVTSEELVSVIQTVLTVPRWVL